MPVIRVSDETMKRLKRWAEPLVDTPETALSKALDAAERAGLRPATPVASARKASAPKRNVRRLAKLPQKEFRRPLLEALYMLGGNADVQSVREEMFARVQASLRPGDHVEVSSGDPRWWNAICWERNALVKEGLLRSDSRRGHWELSEKGKQAVRRWQSQEGRSFVDHLLAMPDVGEDSDFERSRSMPRPVDL